MTSSLILIVCWLTWSRGVSLRDYLSVSFVSVYVDLLFLSPMSFFALQHRFVNQPGLPDVLPKSHASPGDLSLSPIGFWGIGHLILAYPGNRMKGTGEWVYTGPPSLCLQTCTWNQPTNYHIQRVWSNMHGCCIYHISHYIRLYSSSISSYPPCCS